MVTPRFSVTPDIGNSWDVFDNLEGQSIFSGSKALASIAAFAWNAIDENRVLTKLIGPATIGTGPKYAGYYCEDYDGPTEGVKPLPPVR